MADVLGFAVHRAGGVGLACNSRARATLARRAHQDCLDERYSLAVQFQYNRTHNRQLVSDKSQHASQLFGIVEKSKNILSEIKSAREDFSAVEQ